MEDKQNDGHKVDFQGSRQGRFGSWPNFGGTLQGQQLHLRPLAIDGPQFPN